MPLLELETNRMGNETREDMVSRLKALAEIQRQRIETFDDVIIFSPTPGFQEVGNSLILRWKYKQYPQ